MWNIRDEPNIKSIKSKVRSGIARTKVTWVTTPDETHLKSYESSKRMNDKSSKLIFRLNTATRKINKIWSRWNIHTWFKLQQNYTANQEKEPAISIEAAGETHQISISISTSIDRHNRQINEVGETFTPD